MKTLVAAEAVSKDGRSGTSQIPNGLPNVTGRNLRGGSPSSMGCNWSAQSGRLPARGHQESILMMSQLGLTPMKDPVDKLIELTGTSTVSIEDAIESAVKRANKTIKNLCWFQVVETRGNIEKGRVHHWQVTIKVGFTVKE